MRWLVIFITSCFLLCSCQKDNEIENKNTGEKINFIPNVIEFGPGGETIDIQISATNAWKVNDCPDWINISRYNGGEGVSNLQITAKLNSSEARRSVQIIASCNKANASLDVSQEGGILDFNVDDKNITLSFEKQTIQIKPKTNIDYEITHYEGWMTIHDYRHVSNSVAPYDFLVGIQANSTDNPRDGMIVIEGTKVAISDTLFISQSEYRDVIKIQRLDMGSNSVGGCSVYISYTNVSDKVIKYANFGVKFKNNVGDYVKCTISGNSGGSLKDVGPVEPGKSSGGVWTNVIYNHSAKFVELVNFAVEYMDGTKISFDSNQDLIARLF